MPSLIAIIAAVALSGPVAKPPSPSSAPIAHYRAHGAVLLNDLHATPGATLPVALSKLCVSGYTKTVRNVPTAVKKQVCQSYAVPPARCTGSYVEIDHLISLELGGSNEAANLWPQPYTPKPGAREKDKLENYLHAQVCGGKMKLEDAQKAISTDWYAAYLKMGGSK